MAGPDAAPKPDAAPANGARSVTQAAAASRKLRILCIHGYQQNAEVFSSRIGSLRKALRSRAEFFFVDAPTMARPEADANGDDRPIGRTWWEWTDSEPARPSKAVHYSRWEDSLEVLLAALQTHAPIDGLLGAAQTADNFCSSIAGFKPNDDAMAGKIAAARPTTPSLFVWGAADQLVPAERSRQLMECFGGKTETFEHVGAHMVPSCTGDFKRQLVALLEQMQPVIPPVDSQ